MAVGTVFVLQVEHTITGGTWYCLVSRTASSDPLELSIGDIVPLGPEDRYRVIEIEAEHEVTTDPGGRESHTADELLTAEINRLFTELEAEGKKVFRLEYED